jgi:hypothetical protein
VRHALVITQLMHLARTADDEADGRLARQPSAKLDAEPDPAPEPSLATRARRARARTLRLRIQTPGRGA